jgi:alanyl-tRNA synthetase
MTERLYYTDPYARSFDATVRRVEQAGERTVVFLDRTAFYPTTGGQPFDTGTLGGVRVVDVVDEEHGEIAHVVEPPADVGDAAEGGRGAPGAGQQVRGEIDWDRRFDHMQQHTGQHVLSAAFARLFTARTVSFHLGANASTIDLAGEVTPSQIAAAEAAANRVVWEDRPVAIRFASKDEAAAMPLRKESQRDGTLRLIDVEGWDLSACGGTHVARTGAIGIIAISAWERFKGGQRVEFLCGGRALSRFDLMRDALASSVRLLSVKADELPAAIERMQSDAKAQKRAVAALETELAPFRAAELAESAEPTPRGSLVLRALDADANTLKSLATAVAARPGFIVVLVSMATPAVLVAARSADDPRLTARQIVAALVAEFGGRGGGKDDLAQAGGLNGPPAAILSFARSLLVS